MPVEKVKCLTCQEIKDSQKAFPWINGKRELDCYKCKSVTRQRNKINFIKKLIQDRKLQTKFKNYFLIDSKPIALNRPKARIMKNGNGKAIQFYSDQENEKHHTRIEILQQMRSQRNREIHKGPISVHMVFHVPMGSTRCKELEETFSFTKPDIDNMAKFYLDAMNNLVYEDDRLICELHCQKIYSTVPFVEILVIPMGSRMLDDVSLITEGELNDSELNHLLKKANMLGLQKRHLGRCFINRRDGKDTYYFECEPTIEEQSAEVSYDEMTDHKQCEHEATT